MRILAWVVFAWGLSIVTLATFIAGTRLFDRVRRPTVDMAQRLGRSVLVNCPTCGDLCVVESMQAAVLESELHALLVRH